MKLYQALARCVDGWKRSKLYNQQRLLQALPSGSGFDTGTQLDMERSSGEKLVFTTYFHHMNDSGFYTRWTAHTVTVKPSLTLEFTLHVSGPNYRDIKTHIAEVFDGALNSEVTP